jgi:peptidoglycan L-alanyl-D-glutamate endopeptidase CwlK
MAKFKFSERSLKNLEHVHPDLSRLMKESIAISDIDFGILEGLRSPERQQDVIAKGKSWTTNSRHLTGHAVDVGVFLDNRLTWDYPYYEKLFNIIMPQSVRLKIPVSWGGNWPEQDGGHYELTWKAYPLK